MALFSFIIISLINSIFSLSKENKYNSIIESNEFNPTKTFKEEVNNSSDIIDDKWRDLLISGLNYIKINPNSVKDIIMFLKDIKIKNSTVINVICTDLLNESNPILKQTIELLKNRTKGECILDYFIDILEKKMANDSVEINFQ